MVAKKMARVFCDACFLILFAVLVCAACSKKMDSLEQLDGVWFCDVYPTLAWSENVADSRLEFELKSFKVLVDVTGKTISVIVLLITPYVLKVEASL